MKSLFDEISEGCSKNVTKKYSTSFSLAVKMLSPSIQNHIYAIYGFVRLADEIVDSFHGFNKEELLDEFELDLRNAISRKISLNPILNSFQKTVNKFAIEQNLINSFLESMRRDLHKSNYSTVEDYNQYIYGSADVVGLMCLKVFVDGDTKQFDFLKPYAMKLGSALQKVNFLRDIKDDSENLHRSYFPNIDSNELTLESKAQIINEISQDFEQAYIGIKLLPENSKFGVYTAYTYYKRLFSKLENTKAEDILNTRIRVSNAQKMSLLAKSFLNYKFNMI
jgi:phytoene synthase